MPQIIAQPQQNIERPQPAKTTGENRASDGTLGLLTKFASQVQKTERDHRAFRFLLQALARELLVKDAQQTNADRPERTAYCLRNRISKSAPVDIQLSPSEQRARYGNLQVCGSGWTCPVCAMRISERRRRELSDAIVRWRKKGGSVGMLTLTIRHRDFDRLETMLDRMLGNSKLKITGAIRRFKSGRWWQWVKDDYGLAGDIKANEVMHGSNGWHPHCHIVLFFEEKLGEKWANKLEWELSERWCEVLRLEGLDASIEHGARLTFDNREIGKYVTKWGIEHEVTKWVVKQGQKGGRSPMKLLRDYGMGDKDAGRLWLEFTKAYKGRSQLQFSRGLKELLGIEEVSDQTAAEDVKEDDRTLMTLSDLQWWVLKKHHLRGEALRAAEMGGASAVVELIASTQKDAAKRNRASQKPLELTSIDLETGEKLVRHVQPTDPDYDYLKSQLKGEKTTIVKLPDRRKPKWQTPKNGERSKGSHATKSQTGDGLETPRLAGF